MAKKPIPGYEGLYEVTESGEVWSLLTGKLLKTTPDSKRGYQRVWLYKDGIRKEIYVHRAVALAWVDGDLSLTVNHKDGNNQNNHAANLEWISNAENLRHSFDAGIRKRENMGKKCGHSYAIPSVALRAMAALVRAGRSMRSVATEFGYDRSTFQYQMKQNGGVL